MSDDLVFNLHDWAPGCPGGFPEDQLDAAIPYETAALDVLIANGKITDADRGRWRSKRRSSLNALCSPEAQGA